MKQQNFEKGRTGEDIAAEYLEKQNYKILQKNWKTKFGEIDIITSKNNLLVFVEVKLKVGEDFGTPEEMINNFKISQVQSTAIAYLQQNREIEKSYGGYRIDAVCIVLGQDNQVLRINHYENLTF